jgi:hypothetical protein
MMSHETRLNRHRSSSAGVLVLLLLSLAQSGRAEEPNTLTAEEKQAGWQLLFDGRTTDGWRGYRSDRMPESWKVENGSLLARREKGKSAGDIVTVNEYGDFEPAIFRGRLILPYLSRAVISWRSGRRCHARIDYLNMAVL